MKTSTRVWRLADLPLLLLIVIIPLLTGRVYGSYMDSASMLVDMRIALAFFVAYAGFEAAFLCWMTHRARKPVLPRTACAFAWRIQLQVAMQVVTRGAVILFVIFAFDDLTSEPAPVSADLPAQFSWPVFLFLAQLAIVYSISISWWRCLSLKRNGADFSALFAGTFNEKRIAIQAACEHVAMVLDKHVERLMSEMTPRFSRMFYQANVNIIRSQPDRPQSYSLSWALLPIRVVVTLAAHGAAAAELRVRCELRGGIHRLELFPNPAVVLAVMRYLQTNLLEPLTSELALSVAVRKQDELRHQAVESQLRILQAQIEPHFLFNTLANVRHLYRSSVEQGESMMDHLIVYLRSTLEELRSDVSTVSKELDLVLHYLAIMKIRMGERLSYSFINSADVTSMAFPPAMLISLVENAIMHGLNNKPDGKLSISAVREQQHLRLTVLDNGAGFSSVQGSGVGLSNIRQRLEAIYGNRAWLEVGAMAAGGFMACIVIPISENE
ncbi:sensor histidine kinase [Massilia sp. S19_KUP03_FR1]|uniref:sensor histidine kinase n=1 Tax=Massilia sp. S19_KUP03_FR1 TaxID=3025503 RepID=UPI002FCD89DC